MTLLHRILCLFSWAFAASLAFAQTLPLYVAPATDHSPVARAAISGSAIDKATPVLEAAKKAEGWYWAEYTGPFNGYIERRDVGERQRPRVGAIVYAEPRNSSPVITTVEEGDLSSSAEALSDGQFYRISLNKTIGIYFNARLSGMRPPEIEKAVIRRSTPPRASRPAPVVETPPAPIVQPPPVVASAPVETNPPPPQPRTTSRARQAPRVAETAPPPQPAPAPVITPEPMVETSRAQVRPPAERPPAPRGDREVEVTMRQIPLPPVVIENSVTLGGTLMQAGRRWLVIKPQTPYMLVDDLGERIAWIDLSNAVLSRPLPDLLGAKVTVYGEWRKRETNEKVILQVRSIRLAL